MYKTKYTSRRLKETGLGSYKYIKVSRMTRSNRANDDYYEKVVVSGTRMQVLVGHFRVEAPDGRMDVQLHRQTDPKYKLPFGAKPNWGIKKIVPMSKGSGAF